MQININLVYPLCAMFFLTLIVMLIMFTDRVTAIKKGAMKVGYFKTYNEELKPSERVIKSTRHFANLFEAPILFYVACLLGMILPLQSVFFLALAWLYVFARAAHAVIHIGPNKLLFRMTAYGIGWLCLALMWISILVDTLLR
ncbi:MAG: MAPEG family protein [Bdellovibrio sp.]|nr:MAPEG family protein [Bdellovibrio sp.]